MTYPIKLDDAYPCRGESADGSVVFDDLLEEGQIVAAFQDADRNTYGPFGVVVRKGDGLWVIARAESRAREAAL